MNRETIIVYTIAALIGSALAYLVNIPTGIVAGLSTIGATVILWHAFDTVRGFRVFLVAIVTPPFGDTTLQSP